MGQLHIRDGHIGHINPNGSHNSDIPLIALYNSLPNHRRLILKSFVCIILCIIIWILFFK